MTVHDKPSPAQPGAAQTGGLRSGSTGAAERAYGVNGAGSSNRPSGGKIESDAVNLSNLGQALHETHTDSPERTKRVEELKSAVQSGNYKVDPEKLAQSLVDEALKDGGL